MPEMFPQLLADFYVHQWDPFVVQFTDRIGIRWYGLAYVLGFFAAYWLLVRFAKKGYTELEPNRVADFITLAAFLGVMLGGRLGYFLLYNREDFFDNPKVFFNFLDGGMASHGGIFGLVIFTWFYAWKMKISWTGIGDNLVTVAPLGLLFGRLANFINGELYGQISKVPWAVKFPEELVHRDETTGQWLFRDQANEIVESVRAADAETGIRAVQLLEAAPNPDAGWFRAAKLFVETSWENEAVRNAIAGFLNPRHPSQIYEAIAEGLLLFLLLYFVRVRWKNLYHGILTGLFFIFYAIGRISCEFFREPDSTQILGFTKGQFYSLFMILVGAGFLVWGLKTKRTNRA
ncbi:MAG: prolipoprotein diacylglyceryl transferase [Verrucomicrobiales bacterium]|nr:prolipoprotein diacylglyceryl transferase [Verrucomicrobiales bacterium]